MVKYILSILIELIAIAFINAAVDVEFHNQTSCYNVYCKSDEHCCFSRNNGAVCCSAESMCDSELGCVNNGSTSNVRKCPPLTTRCLFAIFFDLCCPLPFAKCCNDMIHCCPHGYECDLQNMRCNKKNNTSNDSRIFKRDVSSVNLGMKQCGDKVWCSKGDECCKDVSGDWKCCKAISKARTYKNIL